MVRSRSIGSRMIKASKRSDLEVGIVIASELANQLKAYALLVHNLRSASRAVPTTITAPGSTTPSIDVAYYVNTIVTAMQYTLRSPTVVALMANIDSLVNVNALALNAVEGCQCIGKLGLQPFYDDLIVVVSAGLSMQKWCHSHPVGVPANSTNSTPVPNTAGAPITIGLDDILNALGIASQNSHVDVFDLGPGLTSTVNSLLNGLKLGPKNTRPRSLEKSSTCTLNPELLTMTKNLVDAVVILKNCDPNLPQPSNPPTHPHTPTKPPADYNLINAILQATWKLLNSHTVSTFVGNVDILVNVNRIVAGALESCGCADSLDLAGLLKYLAVVIDAALSIQDWCTHNPIGIPESPSTSVPVQSPTATPTLSFPSNPSTTSAPLPPNTEDTTVIVDLGLTTLLDSLGLGLTPGGNLPSLGNLLGGIIAPVSNPLPGNPTGSPINAVNAIDSALLSQVQALVNLTLVIQSGSAILPPVPYNSTGVPPMPIDGNLVTGIIQATLDLLNSGTVGELLDNLQVLVKVNTLVQSSLTRCGCVDQLGLGRLVKDVDVLLATVLNLQSWCANNPVVVPSKPHTSSFPTPTTVSGHKPTPTTGLGPVPIANPNSNLLDLVIDLGLDNLASALNVDLATNVNATVNLRDLLNVLVGVAVQIRDHSTSLPPASTTIMTPPTVTAPATAGPLTSPVPLTQGTINHIVQSVAILLNSTTTAKLLTDVNALLNVSGLLKESMDSCRCVDSLGLHALEDDLNALLSALLTLRGWCNHRLGSNSLSESGSGRDIIRVDTHDLLAALGLDETLQVKSDVPGLGLGGLVNPLLHGIGLGGVRRWVMY
ncbi:hypothetical protein C0992_002893 [Termitomyces sp. T32_za158]|nr:hypothetical protein C0992_002893 [Termitomyces sp. T32_za158]